MEGYMNFNVVQCVTGCGPYIEGEYYAQIGSNNGIGICYEDSYGDIHIDVFQTGGIGKGLFNSWNDSGKPSFDPVSFSVLDVKDTPIKPTNVMHHKQICSELNSLYDRKNHDYGDSFHTTYEKWGLTMAAIRLGDKLQRFETLIKSDSQVADESIRDTLIDLANYAIMTVMELDREGESQNAAN